MVEAPAGYGKTTAGRLAMETVPEDEVFWYTATESMADGSMDWFIHQIYLADRDAGTALRALGLVNRSNAGKAAGIISEMRVEKTRYLIVDNFQLVLGSWPLPVLLDVVLIVLRTSSKTLRDASIQLMGDVCGEMEEEDVREIMEVFWKDEGLEESEEEKKESEEEMEMEMDESGEEEEESSEESEEEEEEESEEENSEWEEGVGFLGVFLG